MIDLTKLNDAQKEAVLFEKGNMLLSASAGSGKTHVIIQRLIRLITEKKVSVSEVLALTFSNMAAEEMRVRLKHAVMKEYATNPTPFLHEQLSLLSQANISTIHSFCLSLIKQNFFLVGLDANFRIAEDFENTKLTRRAIDALMQKKYEEKDKDFLALLEIYSKKRSDKNLAELILKTSDALGEQLYKEDFIAKTKSNISASANFGFNIVKELYTPLFESILNDLEFFNGFYANEPAEKKRGVVCLNAINYINGFSACKNCEDYYAFSKLYGKDLFSLVGVGGSRKNSEINADFKGFFENFRTVQEEISKTMGSGLEEDILKGEREIFAFDKLVKLAEEYDEIFSAIKKEEGVVDYDDLEKYACKLLKDDSVKESVKEKFKYVLIDEYQDVNERQEFIINSVSEGNLFAVGDLKQCIYAFRGSKPKFLVNRQNKYLNDDGGKTVNLDVNYRCSKKVVDGVNEVFGRIMTKNTCGVDYSNYPMLYGEKYADYEGECKLHYYPVTANEKDKVEGVYSVKNAVQLKDKGFTDEADYIINLLENNVGVKDIFLAKEQTTRKLQYKDVAIIMRSITGKNEQTVNDLIKAGVPIVCGREKSVCEYPEIKVLIELLKYLDSFKQDVPFASTLLSFGGLTEDDLSAIRLAKSDGDFCECAKYYSNEFHDEISEKLNDFYSYFENMRLLVPFEGAGKILDRVIKERGYDVKILVSPFGEEKLKRIERFIEGSFSGGKSLGVKEYLNFIENSPEKISLSPSDGDDVVKVITAHASKGLEFPFVIFAGNQKGFNFDDVEKGELLNCDGVGISLASYDASKMQKGETVYRKALKLLMKKQLVEEEIRILYVILTRAECCLHVLIPEDKQKKFNESLVFKSRDFCGFFTDANLDIGEVVSVEGGVKVEDGVLVSPVSEEIKNAVTENLNYTYPYIKDCSLPLKRSVSEVNARNKSEEIERVKSLVTGEKGTAYHRFLELYDFGSNKSVNESVDEFIKKGSLGVEEAKLLDLELVDRILNMDIFESIKGGKLYKEAEFCYLASPEEVGLEGEDGILVQGVIDLLAVKEKGAVLIDYKLSTIKNDEDLINAYKTQVKLYKCAVEKVLKIKVEKVYLVNILQCRTVEVAV